jgi:hypothetical protein
VTPKPPDGVARRKHQPKACSDDRQAGAPSAATAPVPVPARFTPQAGANDAAKDAANAPPQADAAATMAAATTAGAAAVMPAPRPTPGASGFREVAVASDDPTLISIEPWGRLLDGELYAASSRA